MSNRSKKFKMKKPLTLKELARRQALREKRAERKRYEKKAFLQNFLGFAFLFLSAVAVFVVLAVFDEKLFLYALGIVFLVGILVCDNGGLRNLVFNRYPESFPFAHELKRPAKGQCTAVELSKTIGYYSVLFYIFIAKLRFVFAALWLICCAVALLHLIFDDETAIRPDNQRGLSTAGDLILLTSFIMTAISIENISSIGRLLTFAGIFTAAAAVFYLVIARTWHEHKDHIFVFILSAAVFSFAGFFIVNKEFDFSEPQFYELTVIDKQKYSGRNSISYDLYVEDWNNSGDTVGIDVSFDTYENHEVGDEIIVEVYSGALGMEYYSYEESAD